MLNQLDTLFTTLSHPNFLAKRGLANEVPIFIKTYRPQDEDLLPELIDKLSTRLKSAGIETTSTDLLELVLGILEEKGWLADTLEMEPTLSKRKFLDMLASVADPKMELIPKLAEASASPQVQLSLISGVGHVFPFLRTHTILENLQPAMASHPVILFFPGEYRQNAKGKFQLRLFGQELGQSNCSSLIKGYYRAFNLDQYRP